MLTSHLSAVGSFSDDVGVTLRFGWEYEAEQGSNAHMTHLGMNKYMEH